MNEPLYGTGDYIEIINYGHLIWESNPYRTIDIRPEFVGKKALVIEHTETQGIHNYSLQIDGYGHVSWFIEEQMKLIKSNQSKL